MLSIPIRSLSSSPELTKKSKDRTLTHAHLIETSQILAPGWKHLSPCLGAAMESSPFCGNLFRIGTVLASQNLSTFTTTKLTPPAKLATQLLFQADRHQPVRMTRKRSMAAAHLTPQTIGTILALSNQTLPSDLPIRPKTDVPILAVEEILRAEGIRSNYVQENWTGVSLQRWKNLIAESPATLESSHAASSLIIPLWLKGLWEISRDKSCLLEFLLAVERTTQQSILNNDELGNALRHDPTAQREWSTNTFDPKSLSSDSVASALDVLMNDSPYRDHAGWSRALEVTCASMAVQHAYKPAIAPGKYGYDGGDPKSDCVEVTVRELFDLLLWDESTGTFDLSRLPPTASQELIDLYAQQGDGERWFHVLSDLPGCDYLMKSPNGKSYELTPTLANVAEVTRLLLGVGGARASSLDRVSEIVWNCQQKKLHVSARVSRHRAALGEEMVVQEIATAFLEGGKNGIEMRLDKAHGICTVTHLRLQNSILPDDSVKTLLSSFETMEPAIKIVAHAMLGDRGLVHDDQTHSDSDFLWKLLATPFGPDRRGLLHVVGTPDLARRERDLKRNLQESQEVIRRAVSKVCKLNGSPELQKQLLAWLLSEKPAIVDDETVRSQVNHHDTMIEDMVLNLPTELLADDAVHGALHSSWAVRGKLVARLAKIKSGVLPVSLDAVRDLSVVEIISLVSLCARTSLARVL